MIVSSSMTKVTPKLALALARARPQIPVSGKEGHCMPPRVYITTDEWLNSCLSEGKWLDALNFPHPKFPKVSRRWGERPSTGTKEDSEKDEDEDEDEDDEDDEEGMDHISPYGLLDGFSVYIPEVTFGGVTMRREAIALVSAEAGARLVGSPQHANLILHGSADNGVEWVRGCMDESLMLTGPEGGAGEGSSNGGGSSSSSAMAAIGSKDFQGKVKTDQVSEKNQRESKASAQCLTKLEKQRVRELSSQGRVVHFEFLFESLRAGKLIDFTRQDRRTRINSSGFGMLNAYSILPPELYRERNRAEREYGVKKVRPRTPTRTLTLT